MSRSGVVLSVSSDAPDSEAIGRAVTILRAGGLVAFPTETVYGLGADARNAAAIRAVFEGKGRPATDPLIVHVHSVDAARRIVTDWPPAARRLAEAFWPGPLTLVLPRAPELPAALAAGRSTVAVRVPAHPVAVALLRAADLPVAAPSANRFGRISPTTAQHVHDELDGVYDLLLDGGATPLGVESTVVDLTGAHATMLRPGGVTLEDLSAVLGHVEHRERTVVDERVAATAPGEFLQHYAPRTPLVLVEGGAALARRLIGALSDAGLGVGTVPLASDPQVAARELYAHLRSADASGVALLVARTVDPAGIGRAVNDRLFRAAHGRVVLDDSEATVARLVALVSAD